MFRQIIVLSFLISGFSIFIQTDVKTQFAIRHEAEDPTRPDWINEMYKKNADPGKVISLYEEYYKTNEFVKNEHTQYYKRWIRSILRENNRTKDEDRDYAQKSTKQNSTRTNDDWSCIGPIDWDHSAAARSYAPGSAHVYTVEQSISQSRHSIRGYGDSRFVENHQSWGDLDTSDKWTASINRICH
ncbi:MAG: hypothetical protein IPG79_19800 [Saprospiraceae bacterium]|nr:hypothetical protein [Saprospiraceae bacterium]